jgi:hypothetical protein
VARVGPQAADEKTTGLNQMGGDDWLLVYVVVAFVALGGVTFWVWKD